MKKPKVYFFCRPEEDNLQEDVIALAEGFRELGIPYFSNTRYWRRSTLPGDYLFPGNPDVQPSDCDVVVVSYTWPRWVRMRTFEEVRQPLPEAVLREKRSYRTVYMDHHDGHRTVSWEPEYRKFDLILRAKLNRRAWHPSNLQPWATGLNDRVLRATAGGLPFRDRSKSILISYGASHGFPHGTREISAAIFEPRVGSLLAIDRTRDDLSQVPTDPYAHLMWQQTGGRYSPGYYERLKRLQGVACFCGELVPPLPFRNPEIMLRGGNKAALFRAFFGLLGRLDPRPPRSVQWDSFRFWETLAAGAAAFNLDLGHYGVDLPEMPTPGKHYVGIDLARPQAALDQLVDDPAGLEAIAAAGREWAQSHYSPVAQARRFLGLLGFAN